MATDRPQGLPAHGAGLAALPRRTVLAAAAGCIATSTWAPPARAAGVALQLLMPPRGAAGSAGLGALSGAEPTTATPPAQPASAHFSAPRFAAAWDDGAAHRIGILAWQGAPQGPAAGRAAPGRLQALDAIDVPTRGHGLLAEPGGSVLAVARRPGDWLLRWHPGRPPQWVWAEPGRALNGHALHSADGRHVFTTETDLDSGAGLVGVRDARSLAKTAEWPTHGIDPHELLLDAGGRLIVANGGISTQPETGRAKLQLQSMDSSLVRLETARGECTGQWRLRDRRLSLRHLAQGLGAARLTGVALQAQHDDPAALAAAPVLALFDGERLTAIDPPEPLAGYAGDIAAQPNGFVLSCPRANVLVVWQADGTWAPPLALAEACALAPWPGGAPGSVAALHARPRPDESPAFSWAAGRGQGCAVRPGVPAPRYAIDARCRIDNHWVLAAG